MKDFSLGHCIRTSTVLCIVLVFLVSCGSNEKNITNSVFLKKTILEIEHGDQLISNMFVFTKIIGVDSLVYFEPKDRDFYLFDLREKSVQKFLDFEFDGPNFMENFVLDFQKLDDQYFILSSNYLHVIERDGSVLKRISVSQMKDDFNNALAYRVTEIDRLNESELILAKNLRSVAAPNSKVNGEPSIFARLNINTESIKDIPIGSPEETLINDISKGYYGSLSEHSFIMHKDSNCIVFNFKFSPTIYRYCFTTESVELFDGRTERFPNGMDPISSEKYRDREYLIKVYLRNKVNFSNIEYDKKNDVFTRMASETYYDDESKETSISNYIQIFDSDFDLLKEEKVSEPVSPYVHLSGGAIYMLPVLPSQDSENKTTIIKYEIKF
ncbi:DUF4221 family protein [Roseivirga echinicomitans]